MKRRLIPVLAAVSVLAGGSMLRGQAAPPAQGGQAGETRKAPTVEDVHRLHANPKAYIASLEDPARDQWQRPREVLAALELRGGEHVADIGAGSGYFALRFARHVGPSGRVYAVDVSADMIGHLEGQARNGGLDNVRPILAPPDDPRLPASAIDLVFICNTWHHIADHPRYLDALRRAMKPTGRLVLVDWQKDDLRAGPPPELRVSRESVVAEFQKAGFRLTGEPAVLPYQYYLVFSPPASAGGSGAQAPAAAQRPPSVVSPEVRADGRLTIRIYAPSATNVFLNAGDLPPVTFTPPGATPVPQTPGSPGATLFAKGENGVWEFTTAAPVPPGAFRYAIMVDGVRTLDPVNTRTSESNTAMWSLFFVPGIALEEVKDVPHGAIAEVFYASSVLKITRRMHVYTPPGYEAGTQKYPVFYLLHGAGDTDDAWTSVGRAGFILDNLIAAKQAVPMIVVMPAGHQPPRPGAVPGAAGVQPAAGAPPAINPFTLEFVTDVMPYVERHYRVLTDRPNRAIAGLSMGGSQTLDIAFRHLTKFAYMGVYSSGAVLGGGRGAAAPPTTPPPPDWETIHAADLDNAALKKGTRLIWLATGVDDRLIANTRATVEILKKHGFEPEFAETPGAHTWLVWRDYLRQFAPRLFK